MTVKRYTVPVKITYLLSAMLLIVATFLTATIPSKAARNCSSDKECPGYNAYCCQAQNAYSVERFCRSDCVGYYCRSDDDCGDKDECCDKTKGICIRFGCRNECLSKAHCLGRYCCTQRWPKKINVCRSSCVGQPCNRDRDCGAPGEICDSQNNICTKKHRFESKSKRQRTLSAWKISVILICALILLAVVIVVIYFKRKRRSHEGDTSRPTMGGAQVTGVNADIQLNELHGEGNHTYGNDKDALLTED